LYDWKVVDDPGDADVIHTLAVDYHPDAKVYSVCGFWEDPPSEHVLTQHKIEKMVRETPIVTMPSQWVCNFFQKKCHRDDFIIVGNGVDVDRMAQVPRGKGLELLGLSEPYFLWGKAGNYYPNCNYGSRPVIDLAKEMPDIHFVIVAPVPYELPPNVTVTGQLPYEQMLWVIADSLALISTVKETFGAQTVEAMAMGKPVLGYDFGGNSELILHKVNGYLTMPGSALFPGATYILENLDTFAPYCRKVAALYDWKTAVTPIYASCWERACK